MPSDNPIGRRDFLKSTPLVLGAVGALAQSSLGEETAAAVTVGDVIDRVLEHAGVPPVPDTVDTLKVGDRSRPVNGIAVTFLATTDVIKQAIEHKADFIITHEPTFYGHRDETSQLADDPVYQHKRALLDDHGISVWRYHDHLHRIAPDPIFVGLIDRLGWAEFIDPQDARLCHIPATTLADLAQYCKQRLGSDRVNFVGDPALPCRDVGLLPGAWGGARQIAFLGGHDIDVIICGEVAEWETNIYVHDSQHTAKPLGLIVTGHQCSEEDGMRMLADWLKTQYPAIPVTHLPSGDVFTHV